MQCTTNFSGREMIHNKNERIKTGCRLMLTHFSSFSFQITAYFSLIFEPIMDQVCLLYPFLRSIHFQFLMLLEISMLQGTFSPGYLGEPYYLFLYFKYLFNQLLYSIHIFSIIKYFTINIHFPFRSFYKNIRIKFHNIIN